MHRTHAARRTFSIWSANCLLLAAALAGWTGCDGGGGGGGGGGDIGDNNKGVFVAMGDSITNGRCVPAGAPYPERAASASGNTVINEGRCGEESSGGAARVSGVLSRNKPEGLLILYGANDVIRSRGLGGAVENLRAIVQAAKANQTRPLLATLTPMYDGHAAFQGRAEDLNVLIRSMAKEEGVKVVNLEGEFGNERDLIQADGLHPSDMGTQVIAFAFADRM